MARNKAGRLKQKGISQFKKEIGWKRIKGSTPFDNEADALRHMQETYNKWGNKTRYQAFKKKGVKDFQTYETIVNILGNKNFIKLKEGRYLDSTQLIDLIKKSSVKATEKEIENALLNMINRLNHVQQEKDKAMNDALEAGFSASEALEYAGLVADDLGGFQANEGLSVLVDEIMQEIGRNQKREAIRNKLNRRR